MGLSQLIRPHLGAVRLVVATTVTAALIAACGTSGGGGRQPDMGSIEWKFVLPLCASITYSIRAILVRTMAGVETATQIVFHTRLGGAILTTLPMFYFWQSMTTMDVALLIIITIVQLNAHLLITRSTVMASLSVVGPVEYSALLWNGMLGYLIWNEIPTNNIWIGAIFIITVLL